MHIEAKNWIAQNDRMPGPDGGKFRVYGTLTVGHSGFVPSLVKCDKHSTASTLALDITVEKLEGVFLQAVVDKAVSFSVSEACDSIESVEIYYQDQLLSTIDNILVTH
ncbi:hypothetical protein [Pseudomonas fontis]|uniref:Uncharacterized protein n=1 Tax=Pseudomonas fontis TaxID=2942633 RepID=A0ABT5NMB3_9PSED|nr:hypothetical protein [Pseudomonas fontis]MDD0975957.1 hypothetical protein [Pseudomonas fontis]MDD0989110.1 hypothetical protein [Pseudomonas fontis]